MKKLILIVGLVLVSFVGYGQGLQKIGQTWHSNGNEWYTWTKIGEDSLYTDKEGFVYAYYFEKEEIIESLSNEKYTVTYLPNTEYLTTNKFKLDSKVFYQIKSKAVLDTKNLNVVHLVKLNNKYYYLIYTDMLGFYYFGSFHSTIKYKGNFEYVKHKAKKINNDKNSELYFLVIEISEYIAFTKFEYEYRKTKFEPLKKIYQTVQEYNNQMNQDFIDSQKNKY